MDLMFPHHENEIAQSEAARGLAVRDVWMHNGFVQRRRARRCRSRSATSSRCDEVLEWVRDPEVVRYFIVNSQYRGPINYTPDSLAQADAALERLYTSLRGVPVTSPASAGEVGRKAG